MGRPAPCRPGSLRATGFAEADAVTHAPALRARRDLPRGRALARSLPPGAVTDFSTGCCPQRHPSIAQEPSLAFLGRPPDRRGLGPGRLLFRPNRDKPGAEPCLRDEKSKQSWWRAGWRGGVGRGRGAACRSRCPRHPDRALGRPHQFTISADGATVLFLRSGNDRWLPVGAGCPLGERRLLADPRIARRRDCPRPSASAGNRDRRHGHRELRRGRRGPAGGLRTVRRAVDGGDIAAGRIRRLPAAGAVVDPRPDPTRPAGRLRRQRRAAAGGAGTGRSPRRPEEAFGWPSTSPPNRWAGASGGPRTASRCSAGGQRGGRRLVHRRPGRSRASRRRAVRYPAVHRQRGGNPLGHRARRHPHPGSGTALPTSTCRSADWDPRGPFATVKLTTHARCAGSACVDRRHLAAGRAARRVELVPGSTSRFADGSLVSHAEPDGARYLTVNGAALTPPGSNCAPSSAWRSGEVCSPRPRRPTRPSSGATGPGRARASSAAEPGVAGGGAQRHAGRVAAA